MSTVNLDGCTIVMCDVGTKAGEIGRIIAELGVGNVQIIIADTVPITSVPELTLTVPEPLKFTVSPEFYDIGKERREHLKRCQPWKRKKKGK